jgi:predicted RNA-binding Zn-ribbon protein involved in translation (DUF1610 family)
MESKYYKYKYKWNTFNMIVDCTKCGNNIVLQDFEGSPTCNECGNINKPDWETTIRKIDVVAMKRDNVTNHKMLGTINATTAVESIDQISCYHCNSVLELPEQGELKDYICNNCKQPVTFKEYEGLDELLFYKAGAKATATQEAVKMIAVRCVSCGAPLEVDPAKNNFSCKFCSTENILPVSLRYKVVLADIFVGIRNSKYLKLAAFQQDGQIVQQTLRENGKESFANDELNTILLNSKNDVGVYNQITGEFKHLPPDSVLNELFNTSTNQTLIGLVGSRLQKSKEEIEARIDEIAPKQKEKEAEVYYQQAPQKKSFFKTPLFYIALVFIVVLLILLAYKL